MLADDSQPPPTAFSAHDLSKLLRDKRVELLTHIERRLGAALRTKVDPEDIFQEISGDALRAVSSGAMQVDLNTPAAAYAWLCQLTERRIVDAQRHHFGAQKRNAAREVRLAGGASDSSQAGIIDLLVASITTATQALARNDREARLLAALEQLPADQRQALQWRYLEGLPSKEIAERLKKSDGAVRVMLTRALNKLHELIGTDGMTFLR